MGLDTNYSEVLSLLQKKKIVHNANNYTYKLNNMIYLDDNNKKIHKEK